MKRLREPEIMESPEEVVEYDDLARHKLSWILESFASHILGTCPSWRRGVDLGTGTGELPRLLASKLKRSGDEAPRTIVGVDRSTGMLDVSRRLDVPENVDLRWVQADINRLPLEDNAFDLVVSHLAMHHLDDPVAFLNEVDRIAAPGATILIRDVLRPPARAVALIEKLLFTPGYSRYQRKMYYDSIRAAFTAEELTDALRRSTLQDCRLARYFITHVEIQRLGQGQSTEVSTDLPTLLSKFVFKWTRRVREVA